MPQLDLATYFVQVVLVIVSFTLFFLYIKLNVIVRVAEVRKMRKKLLAQAEFLSKSKESPKALYSAIIKYWDI